jgi:hypothetical protein
MTRGGRGRGHGGRGSDLGRVRDGGASAPLPPRDTSPADDDDATPLARRGPRYRFRARDASPPVVNLDADADDALAADLLADSSPSPSPSPPPYRETATAVAIARDEVVASGVVPQRARCQSAPAAAGAVGGMGLVGSLGARRGSFHAGGGAGGVQGTMVAPGFVPGCGKAAQTPPMGGSLRAGGAVDEVPRAEEPALVNPKASEVGSVAALPTADGAATVRAGGGDRVGVPTHAKSMSQSTAQEAVDVFASARRDVDVEAAQGTASPTLLAVASTAGKSPENAQPAASAGPLSSSSPAILSGPADPDADDESLLAGEGTTQTPMYRLDNGVGDSDYVTDEEPPYNLRLLMRRRESAAAVAAAEAASAAVVQAERHLLASLLIFPLSCPIVEDGSDSDTPDGDFADVDKVADARRNEFNPSTPQRRDPVPLSRKRLNAVARFRAKRKRLQDPVSVPPAPPADPLLWKTRLASQELPFAPPNPIGLAFDAERLVAIRRFHRRRGTLVSKVTGSKRGNPSAAMAGSLGFWSSEKKQLVCKCITCAPKSLASAVAHQSTDGLFDPGWATVVDDFTVQF